MNNFKQNIAGRKDYAKSDPNKINTGFSSAKHHDPQVGNSSKGSTRKGGE